MIFTIKVCFAAASCFEKGVDPHRMCDVTKVRNYEHHDRIKTSNTAHIPIFLIMRKW